jgi:lipid A 4'-phosphatase
LAPKKSINPRRGLLDCSRREERRRNDGLKHLFLHTALATIGEIIRKLYNAVMQILLAILLLVGVLTGVVFAVDPALDLQSALSFHALLGRVETWRFYPAIEWFRQLGPLVLIAAAAPAVITIMVKMFVPARRAPMTGRAALFVLLSLALGPGLLVNGILKPYWPRARPYMVSEFGGEYAFTPWWDWHGTCDSNCSFVSGEVAGAAWLAAPAMMLPPPLRTVALCAVAVYGAAIAFIRLLVGGHFVSDVIFAVLITGLVTFAVHRLLFRRPESLIDERMVDGMLARCGAAVLRTLGVVRAPPARPDEPPA